MIEYQKINTIFFRDEKNCIMPNDSLVREEFDWLRNCKFEATEKIDGTNMSIQLIPHFNIAGGLDYECRICGKSETSSIPSQLIAHMQEKFPKEKIFAAFNVKEHYTPEEVVELDMLNPTGFAIFGEGYGAKIQKGGGNYISNGVDFIVFDVKIGQWWLKRDAMIDVAKKIGADYVPLVGMFTIDEAIEYVRKGFNSSKAEVKDFKAEGLVLKSPYGILFRNGERVIFKVKTRDFVKWDRMYGNQENPVQTRNPHIVVSE